MKVQSPNHWTAKEFPQYIPFKNTFLKKNK